MRRGVRRGLALGSMTLLVALWIEATRPRGGMSSMIDWDEVSRVARSRLDGDRMDGPRRGRTVALYRRLAAALEDPLLETVGGLPPGRQLPEFQALDRLGWLDLNLDILRRVLEPLLEATRVPNSWLADLGRAGLDHYVGLLLAFLGRRVLGQFDPQLLGREPIEQALYLVEPNVADWEAAAGLPGRDLRRWLILHEMTHAWQFAAHPWLREHLNVQLQRLIQEAITWRTAGGRPWQALTSSLPAQRETVRRLQTTMTVVEGHGNLVMNLVGARLLPSFDRLEQAYRRRSGERSLLELLIWRVTGLELKLEQYRVGEHFARAIHDRYGMEALNRVWASPETLPTDVELRQPDLWHRRVVESR
ncbi:MAG TPA: zinc-dependent metalloprotease [Candidatus Dormibacteraeota bacterium]|nr:zinc-dependent metalloprotease [Candidatus Dormibacteraeota bacterium]